MAFPKVALVKQSLTSSTVPDVPNAVRAELRSLPLSTLIKPQMRVAIGVGSRGIGCIRAVVSTVLDELHTIGARPFLVPAMGSHGGGTAEGQREVLAGYGFGVNGADAPIHSDINAVYIGEAETGMPVYFDPHANGADAIIVVNRVKPHTAFRNPWESGLLKMLAIGLGKPEGAATIHGWGIEKAMPAAARFIIANRPVVAGIAIVENGYHEPAIIRALTADQIEEEEPKLLQEAWKHLPLIPLEPLDLLVLQEIGKDISGTGMDMNVVGMWRRNGGPVEPVFRVITALDLTENSHGNAVGVGFCDIIPERLRNKINFAATYKNCLTAGNYNGAKLPITLPTDRDVIAAALPVRNPEMARIVVARNTLELGMLWVSESLLPEIEHHRNLEQVGELRALEFTDDGALLDLALSHTRNSKYAGTAHGFHR